MGKSADLNEANDRRHRAARVRLTIRKRVDAASVAVRPMMGVILWGESLLYLLPVSFMTRRYTKCNSEES